MTEVTAYNNPNAPAYRQWIAYVVMDNGQLWGVYAIGSSEDEAKGKISHLWESERQKANVEERTALKAIRQASDNPWASLNQSPSQHHLAGLKWIINDITGAKCRVSEEKAVEAVKSHGWRYGKK